MTKKKTSAMIRTLLTALISLGVTIYFIVICFNGLSRQFIEDGWSVTHGTILSQDIALTSKNDFQRKNQGIEQVLNYEYEIEGEKYRSNSVSREVMVRLNDYPEGKVVDVYYNPKRVYDSVLVRTGVQKHFLYGTIVACVFVMFVIFYCSVRDLKALKE